MEFGVLGPLRVILHGVDVTPSAAKQRQMLALLLLTHGHVVTIDEFIKELWDDNPTPTAMASVHTYVMQLRRQFDPPADDRTEAVARRRLVTLERAYRLDVLFGELDLDAFTTRLHGGRAKLAHGDHRAAAAQLTEALDLWDRGPALPDVVAGPLVAPAVRALEVSRLEAHAQRIWAELHLGRHHEIVGKLSALHLQHATNEVFTVQLMLALHRSGRRTDALDVFHRHRGALREELGMAPPAQLHELYTDILRSHPRLGSSVSTSAPLSLDLVTGLAS